MVAHTITWSTSTIHWPSNMCLRPAATSQKVLPPNSKSFWPLNQWSPLVMTCTHIQKHIVWYDLSTFTVSISLWPRPIWQNNKADKALLALDALDTKDARFRNTVHINQSLSTYSEYHSRKMEQDSPGSQFSSSLPSLQSVSRSQKK